MTFGMSIAAFTLVHVVLSLVGIVSGGAVVFAMLGSKQSSGWTALFLATTVLTSVTGFFFPREHLLPSHIVGIVSLIVLAVSMFAIYVHRLAGSWRWIYVAGVVVALYLNVFVAVAQAFLKVPWLNTLAPTQASPPFIIVQLGVMAIFVVVGVLALRSFRPQGQG